MFVQYKLALLMSDLCLSKCAKFFIAMLQKLRCFIPLTQIQSFFSKILQVVFCFWKKYKSLHIFQEIQCIATTGTPSKFMGTKKKIHGKELSHDRVKPLLRLFGQGGGKGLYSFCIGCPHPPAWLALVLSSGQTLSCGTKT